MAVAVLSRADVLSRVQAVLVANHGGKEDQFGESAQFETHFAFDSLESVEFSMNLEKEFGIQVPDEVLPTLRSVGDAVDYIEKKLSE